MSILFHRCQTGLVVGAMSSFIAPLVRGLMSKMVAEHEQGNPGQAPISNSSFA